MLQFLIISVATTSPLHIFCNIFIYGVKWFKLTLAGVWGKPGIILKACLQLFYISVVVPNKQVIYGLVPACVNKPLYFLITTKTFKWTATLGFQWINSLPMLKGWSTNVQGVAFCTSNFCTWMFLIFDSGTCARHVIALGWFLLWFELETFNICPFIYIIFLLSALHLLCSSDNSHFLIRTCCWCRIYSPFIFNILFNYFLIRLGVYLDFFILFLFLRFSGQVIPLINIFFFFLLWHLLFHLRLLCLLCS